MKTSNQTPDPNYVTQWSGLSHAKCPRCRRGNVFTGSTYGFKIQKMNDRCPHCNLKFEREPGYFYVAMFVSYAMNVAQMITLAVAAYVLWLPLTYENLWNFCGVLLVGVLLCAPFNYRYSRMILLYYLSPGLHYSPNMAKDQTV